MSDTDQLLRRIADTDDLDGADWNDLRSIIRAKLEKNVAEFELTKPPTPPPFDPTPSTQGGARFKPFGGSPHEDLHLPSYLDENQVKDSLQAVLDQLDTFDEGPPFTLQRLCELLIDPKRHYKSNGKYLRAVEKSILVTSTHGSFPSEPSTSTILETPSSNGTHSHIAFATRSTPSTPLFSPIPFLHEDARLSRSRSRSISPTRLSHDDHTNPPTSPTPEPPTPLLLSSDLPSKSGDVKVEEGTMGLGLVDELDDPSPGHMSEAPTPLTTAASRGKPFLPSLQDRFVKSESSENDSSAASKEEEGPPKKSRKLEEGDKEDSGSTKDASGVKEEDSEKMETDADTKS